MVTYAIIDSKTDKTVEEMDFVSGGAAKRYVDANYGKGFYAKRLWLCGLGD